MAKRKNKEDLTELMDNLEENSVEVQMEEVKEVPSVKVKAPQVLRVLLTFDRWFAIQGKPAHWKAGMAAYIGKQSKGKKTVEEWDRLFKNY